MKYCGLFFAAFAMTLAPAIARADDDWVENTPYYEDDAWYDITEWFDGNDYNPTDEEFWEWDDEVYQVSDQDDAGKWYGYDTLDTDDDWFYDYYDYGYDSYANYNDDDLFEAGYRYYDYDNDGIYDAYVSYYDWDEDGFYEDYNYYAFDETSNEEQKTQARQQAPKESKSQNVTGEIQQAKLVKVRGDRHLVVSLQDQRDQQMSIDLGTASDISDLDLKLGQQITVGGMKTQVGDKAVLLATSVQANGREVELDRSRREHQGEIKDTKKTKVRDQEHLIAIVDTQQGKIAVDLGPAEDLSANLSKGEKLTFSGFPVQVKDRKLMMAQSIQYKGEDIQIDRRKSRS